MWLIPPFVFTCILIFTLLGNGGQAFSGCSANVAYTITVIKYAGHGNFSTIQAAINSIPSKNDRWVRILVSPGFYREKVTIPIDKPCIILQGKSPKSTMISWNAHTITDKSATFTIFADNFVAKNIAFKNAYKYQRPVNGSSNLQSVTVEVVGDKSSFHGCSFFGFQDTLWDAKGRHYFKNCLIEGTVDFIWGSGQSIYEGCQISVLPCFGGQIPGFITAQGRNSANDNSGFVFKGGRVFGNGNTHTYLGRAYGAYSRVIWYGTEFSNIIVPEGWQAWSHVHQE
ncbi:probable pectinesterase 55 [Macadamia integrifolia]|uniref:probable pectinesterase 55 n=1 Tax=Macadamia integrifolia TaxID=60698 RepID=UPI001C528E35|nr:probable pectinesterase 55 [Macadamia integrifolia]